MWRTEENEQRKEEARLLYVALTRAIEQLVVLVKKPPASGSAGGSVNSWSDLMEKV